MRRVRFSRFVSALLWPLALTAGNADAETATNAEGVALGKLQQAKEFTRQGHPNEHWRLHGVEALIFERPYEAIGYFQRAARYADKYSQHRLSLLYWHGQGAPIDRAMAYVWADLAAERGYRPMLSIREKMWSLMKAAERERALAVGEQYYAEYGDDAAKPRLERALRRGVFNATGSRVGATMDRISVQWLNWEGIPLGNYYADGRWKPELYWQREDRYWRGQVEVLPLKPEAATEDREEAEQSR